MSAACAVAAWAVLIVLPAVAHAQAAPAEPSPAAPADASIGILDVVADAFQSGAPHVAALLADRLMERVAKGELPVPQAARSGAPTAALALRDVFVQGYGNAGGQPAPVLLDNARAAWRWSLLDRAEAYFRSAVAAALGSSLEGAIRLELGELVHERNRFAEAEYILAPVMHDPDGRRRGRALFVAARIARSKNNLDEARTLLEAARKAAADAGGPAEPVVAQAVAGLGVLDIDAGRPRDAEKRIKPLIAAIEPAWPLAPELGNLYGVLADALRSRSALAEARTYAEKALELRRATLPPGNPAIATTLSLYARVMGELGDIRLARQALEEALAVRKLTAGESSPRTAASYMDLGNLMVRIVRFRAGREYYKQAAEIRAAALGPDHLDTLSARAAQAQADIDLGEYAEAEALLNGALPGLKKTAGARSAPTADAILLLGLVKVRTGRYADGLTLLRDAVDIRKAVLGADHPRVATTNATLGLVEWGHADRRAGRKRLAAAVDDIMAFLEKLAAVGREQALLNRFATERLHLDAYLTVFSEPADARAAFELLDRWQSALLDAISGRKLRLPAALRDRDDVRALLNELDDLRSTLGALYTSAGNDAQAVARRIAELEQRRATLENQLAALTGGDRSGGGDVSVKTLCERLLPEDGLVRFVRYRRYRPEVLAEKRSEWRFDFAAFVVTGGARCAVRRLELGPADAIEAAVVDWRETLEGRVWPPLVAQAGAALREVFFDPVTALAPDVRRWYVIPDGALAAVPIAALPAEAPRIDAGTAPEDALNALMIVPYLAERYEIGYLNRVGELVPRARPTGKGALLLGAVDYNQAGDAPASGATTPAVGCGGEAWSFTALPGTALELDSVAKIVERGLHEPVERFTGRNALEGVVRRALEGRRFVHLATHGFYAGGCRLEEAPEPVTLTTHPRRPALGGRNPMALSGLVFAGANRRPPDWTGGTGDGVLTALELGDVDLSATELVTMSACETGLGAILDGEGTLGLRRAAAVAGAKSTLTSMWEVPDLDTTLLMTAFYHYLAHPPAGARADRVSALTAAMRALLARQRKEGRPNPRGFGGFILTGTPD